MKKHLTINRIFNNRPRLTVVCQSSDVNCSARYARGVSLLELLIYIAILAVVMILIVNSFVSIGKGRGQAEARSEVNSSLRFSTEKITQDLKAASVVTTPATQGATSQTLVMTVGADTITYDVLAGQLRRQINAGTPDAVTGNAVLVSPPSFTRLENKNMVLNILNATTTSIRTSLTVRYNSASPDWQYQSSATTTVSVR